MDPEQIDEVARQREKHRAARRDRLESILGSLDRDPTEGPADDTTDSAGLDPSPGPQRLRMLARLESLLLQE